MSGPAINARAPVDLEDFEARLRSSAPGGAPQTDPLAELARLVEGRRMPFAPPSAPQNERRDPFVAQREQQPVQQRAQRVVRHRVHTSISRPHYSIL